MTKTKIIKTLICASVISGIGIAFGTTNDTHATSPLTINPQYNRYLESVNAGHGSDWKIIPSPYLPKLNQNPVALSLRADDALPAQYNLREEACGGGTCATKIKDQGREGICWAYSTTSVMESTLLKTTGKRVNLSPKQLDYALASPSTALTDTDTNNYYSFIKNLGVDRKLSDGGNYILADFLIGSNVGPTLDDPFFAGMKANDSSLSSFSNYEERAALGPYLERMPSGLVFSKSKDNNYISTSTVHYQSSIFPSGMSVLLVPFIKQHIMQYGAMGQGSFFNRNSSTCWDASTKTLIDRGPDVCGVEYGHAITIIGWDDNHGYTDGGTAKQGAFLVQNSWGEGDEYTYFYLAYESVLDMFGATQVAQNRWDTVYDETTAQPATGISRAPNEVIVKYSARGEQTIDQIALFDQMLATNEGKGWDLYISTTGQEADFQLAGSINNGPLLSAGRHIAELNAPITVNGDFLVKAKSTSDDIEISDAEAPLFSINVYATGGDPEPSPDIPTPNTGGDDAGPTLGVPNTGFLGTGGAILAAIVIIPGMIAGFFAGRALYRRHNQRVGFDKNQTML